MIYNCLIIRCLCFCLVSNKSVKKRFFCTNLFLKIMDLSKYKFEKEEDKIVFKAIIRTLKEVNMFNDVKGKHKTLMNLINRCYLSRHVHKNESFFQNILYWPSDASMIFGDSCSAEFGHYLFCVLLLKHFNSEILNSRFRIYNNKIFINHKDLFSFKNYKGKIYGVCDLIKDSLIKTGVEEEYAIKETNNLMLLCEAIKLNIPF